MNCVTSILTAIAEAEVHAGPTLIVLVSALAVEYAGSVSVSPVHIMRGLGSLLRNCSGERTGKINSSHDSLTSLCYFCSCSAGCMLIGYATAIRALRRYPHRHYRAGV